jgi:RNA polymerase sigma factor (sigma-70 family)
MKAMKRDLNTNSTLKGLAVRFTGRLLGTSKGLGDAANTGASAPDIVHLHAHIGKTSPMMTILEILDAYRMSGDPALATMIYKSHWHLVLGCALRLLDDPAEAQDAATDVFMKVLERLRMETPHNFGGWLYTVTRYHCFEVRRREKRLPIMEPLEGVKYLADELQGANGLEQHAILEKAVHSALAGLPVHQSKCIRLFYLEEKSYKEIAENEGYSLAEVKSYIQNGKRRLVHLLAPARAQHVSDGGF